jgi:hypothetical protein
VFCSGLLLFTENPRETVRKVPIGIKLKPYERPKQALFVLFCRFSPTKSALEMLLRPLFGQSQKGDSRKLSGY